MEARLPCIFIGVAEGVVMSRLLILGDRTDFDLEEPRVGGIGGRDIVDMLDGLLDGGGGGALALSERGLPISIADIMLELSSSTLGDRRPLSLRLDSFESETSWLCLLAIGGAGGVLRRRDADGEGGSGVFPAASLSKMLSLSESWLARAGAGGSGLLRSVCERCEGFELNSWLELEEPGVFGDANGTDVGSSRNSTFMSFPCLEEGGGGFFRPAVLTSAPRRSSSGSEIS